MWVQEFWTCVGNAPFIRENYEAEEYLEKQEEKRLERAGVQMPSTKWKFLRFHKVDVKVVLTRSPLLGTGLLPQWLRNLAHGRAMVALDSFEDNLSLWRCIAVHQGACVDRSTKAAKTMAKSFYKLEALPSAFPKPSLDELDKVEKHFNQGLPVSDWFRFDHAKRNALWEGEGLHYDVGCQEAEACSMSRRLKEGKLFGFAEVDMHVPKALWEKFEQMCPFFYKKTMPAEFVPKHMSDYLLKTGRGKKVERKKTCGGIVCRKDVGIQPTTAVVLEPRGCSNKDLQNNKL